MSLWRIPFMWRYSNPIRIQQTKNSNWVIHDLKSCLLVCSSVKRLCLPIWYLKSPPFIKSMTRYKFSLSWNAYSILTRNLIRDVKKYVFPNNAYGCLSSESNCLSFMTELTLLFEMTLKMSIWGINYGNLLRFWHFFHSECLLQFLWLNSPDLT